MPGDDGIKEITANSERVKYWISVGAQPSDRVRFLFAKAGLIPETPFGNSQKYMDIPKDIQKKYESDS